MDLETSPMHDRDASEGTPRWVRMTGFVAVALLLLFASLHLIGVRLLWHGDDAVDSGGAAHGRHQP
jgi:hypothetical protein